MNYLCGESRRVEERDRRQANNARATSEHSGVAGITAPLAVLTATLGLVLVSLIFTSTPTLASGLPDGRVFEMVTAGNGDGDVYVPRGLPPIFVVNAGETATRLPFQVATDGEAVAYVGDPTNGGAGNTGLGEGDEFRAKRLSDGGWKTAEIQPPGYVYAFYQAFSPDLSVGVLESGSFEAPEVPVLSSAAPGGGYPVLYARSLDGESYQPFFTEKPPNRAAGNFEAYEVPNFFAPVGEHQLLYGGASADLGSVLFEANDAFVGTGAVDGGPEKNNLYESVGGRLSLVNVLPNGSSEAGATFGAPPFRIPEKNFADFGGVVSGDGSRVFWTDLNTGVLYLSEGVGSGSEKTVQVDASQAGGAGGGGRFWTANSEGTRVFFTDSDAAGLTSNTQAGSGNNLYVYEYLTGRLTDLTAAAEAGVEGVVGEGETQAGEYTVYFAARGVLDGSVNSQGVKAEPGAENLYMLKQGGQPRFIAALSEQDGIQANVPLSPSGREEIGDWQPGLGHRTAEATLDGRSLVFMSNDQSVGGHREEVDGVGLQEVYVYDSENGSLFCASCIRDGVAPEFNQASSEGLGAYLPVSWSATYLPRWISGDGSRVFFDSDEPLVSADTNGEQDVYEWERDGSGECVESSGCVYLLSGGVGETTSWLVGASDSGSDVFMVSRTPLVPGADEAYNLYDARVGGVLPVASQACTETGCQGVPAAPPPFATPSSVTFNGPGNFAPTPPTPAVKTKTKLKPPTRAQQLASALKACHAKRGKARRRACEATARRRYALSKKR